MVTFPLRLSETRKDFSWLLTSKIWRFLEIKSMKVFRPPSQARNPSGVCNSHASPQLATSSLLKSPFRSSYQFMVPVTSVLSKLMSAVIQFARLWFRCSSLPNDLVSSGSNIKKRRGNYADGLNINPSGIQSNDF